MTLYGTFSATAEGRLVLGGEAACGREGVYHWEIADTVLRIGKVSDVCPRRAAVAPGDWAR